MQIGNVEFDISEGNLSTYEPKHLELVLSQSEKMIGDLSESYNNGVGRCLTLLSILTTAFFSTVGYGVLKLDELRKGTPLIITSFSAAFIFFIIIGILIFKTTGKKFGPPGRMPIKLINDKLFGSETLNSDGLQKNILLTEITSNQSKIAHNKIITASIWSAISLAVDLIVISPFAILLVYVLFR